MCVSLSLSVSLSLCPSHIFLKILGNPQKPGDLILRGFCKDSLELRRESVIVLPMVEVSTVSPSLDLSTPFQLASPAIHPSLYSTLSPPCFPSSPPLSLLYSNSPLLSLQSTPLSTLLYLPLAFPPVHPSLYSTLSPPCFPSSPSLSLSLIHI